MSGLLKPTLLEPICGTKHPEDNSMTMAILWFRRATEDMHWLAIPNLMVLAPLLTLISGWLRLIQLEPCCGAKHTEELTKTMPLLWFRQTMEDTRWLVVQYLLVPATMISGWLRLRV